MRKRPPKAFKELPEKMSLLNIHLNKGIYPQSDQQDLNVIPYLI